MSRILIIIFFLVSSINLKSQNIIYPYSKIETEIDTFFKTHIIEDDYRWLENIDSNEVKDWTNNQNKISRKYLDKCSNKTDASIIINKYAYVIYDRSTKLGKYFFKLSYIDALSEPVLLYKKRTNSKFEVLIDPYYISKKEKITIRNYAISKNSKYLAYKFSRNGSDWLEIKIIDIESKKQLEDHLVNIKFSSIEWLNDGFFYSTSTQDGKFGATISPKIYYHKLGQKQEEDLLIFERKNSPLTYYNYFTTEDERFFIIKEHNEAKDKVNLYYIDYKSNNPILKALLANVKNNFEIIEHKDGKFVAETFNQNNGGVVLINPENPLKWETIIPEFKDYVMQNAIAFKNIIFTIHLKDQQQIISVYDYNGNDLYSLKIPIGSSISGFEGNMEDNEVYFSLEMYTIPPVVYKFNVNSFEKTLVEQTSVTYDIDDIEYKRVEYYSKDSCLIPMILVYKKGLQLNGNNPTILETYGGFGLIETPSFNPGIVYFIKNGGVFAYAHIRGGGDKGVSWWQQGKDKNKQNSFNDFIAGAEFLIQSKYTCNQKIAITGASNGGLVVAVAAIQRPDLFKAVAPIVAPFDMLRFEKFTIGHFHKDEFGTVTDSLSFLNLKKYSPYHNIQKELNYPSMLIVTSDNDDRVPPFHSYKFVAALQNRTAQVNPILLKVEKKAGHYGASTWNSSKKEKIDLFGFLMYELTK